MQATFTLPTGERIKTRTRSRFALIMKRYPDQPSGQVESRPWIEQRSDYTATLKDAIRRRLRAGSKSAFWIGDTETGGIVHSVNVPVINCAYCGAEIEAQPDTGIFETGGETPSERRYCTDAPDRRHADERPARDDNDGRFDYLPPREHDLKAFGRVIPDESTRFWVDEDALADVVESSPVEDDHSAYLAIDAAINGNDGDPAHAAIRGGCEVAVELLANGDGELDAYRIIIHPTSDLSDPWIAGHVESVSNLERLYGPTEDGGIYDTAEIIRAAAAEANRLLEWSER